MANVIQLKRGAESARTGFTPAAGEPIYVTDENKLYIGDGSTAVQSLSALGGDLTMANGSNNRVMTATSSSGMNAEANLTFDGSTLAVTGDATVSDDLGLVSDSAKLTFGANSEVVVEHVHNVGLTLKHTATADDKPIALTLQTGETDIAADDVLGKIAFQAPDEGTGTDAILVAAEIAAISEGDFSSSSNATSLHFRTGSSAAAADRIIITSAGHLTPAADGTQDLGTSSLEFKDGYFDGTLHADAINFNGTAISATAAELNIMDGVTASAADINLIDGITNGTVIASKAIITDSNKDISGGRNITISGELDAATLDISGNADIDGTLETDALSINGTTVTSTAAELNILDGVTAAAADINLIDGITNGTVIASKAIITDSNKDISGGRNITISGELDAATLDISGDMDLEGDADVNGTLTTGALVVEGNTTVQNILAGAVSNTIQFEGSTADGNETTLGVIDPNADRTINLPNQDGTLGVFAAASTTQISSTPEELNILDGATVVVGEINALDLGSTAVGNAIASKAVILDSNKDYTGMRNFTVTGELDAATLDISGNADIAGDLTGLDNVTSTNYVVGGHTIDDIDITSEFVDADAHIMSSKAIGARFAVKNADTTGTATNATNAVHVSLADNENTNENNAIVFGEGATYTGNVGLETDGDLHYNPSTGTVTATIFKGNIDAVDGDFDGTMEADAISIGGTAITSTAAELNILDGVTSTAAELNVLDGITAVVGELNLLDMGSTANGTAVASKALVLDSNKDTSGIRNLTISGALDGATVDGGTYS